MAIFLSLVTAACFGTGDFFGGLATKRATVLTVVAFSHVVGLVGLLVLAPFLAESFAFDDALLGAAGGVFGGLGVGLLYTGLARGPMAVVAPLTAITSAAVPSIWGVLTGDAFTALAWSGVALAIVAIGLVSVPADAGVSAPGAPVTAAVVAQALAAGAGFGMMFIFLDATEPASAPWPVVAARLVTSTALVGFIIGRRRSDIAAARRVWPLIVATGVFDTGSNALFLAATHEGSLTIAAVLSSLYPIATVVLARFTLDERISRLQFGGMFAALGATALIAAG